MARSEYDDQVSRRQVRDDPPFDRDHDRGRGSSDRDMRPSRNGRDRNEEDQEPIRRSRYEYKGRTAEDVRRHATQKTSSFDNFFDGSVPTFKPKEGLNVIRFLPPTFGDETSYVYEIHAHYDIGPDHGAYICEQKMFNKPCAVCEDRGKFSEAEQKDLRPRKRYLAWVIDRSEERAGPKLWDLSPSMDKDISAQCLDRHGKITLIDDPENGHDVEFMRSGTRLDTDYTGHKIDRDPSPLHDDERLQDRWMGFVIEHPLDGMIILPDYDYVAKVFAGQVEAKDKDLDKDEPRARVRNRSNSSGDGSGDATRSSRRSLREEIDDEIPERGVAREESEARPRRERLRRDRDPEPEKGEPPRRASSNRREYEEEDEDLDREMDEPPARPRRASRGEPEEDISERTRSRLRDMEERNTRRR